MALPNFRLPTVQAKLGLLAGLAGLLTTVCLAVLVFKGYVRQQGVIPYNEHMGLSQYRRPLIFVATAFAVVLGGTGGVLGFNSLGQARNAKQNYSWLGMILGAFAVGMAPVMLFAWQKLSEAIIMAS